MRAGYATEIPFGDKALAAWGGAASSYYQSIRMGRVLCLYGENCRRDRRRLDDQVMTQNKKAYHRPKPLIRLRFKWWTVRGSNPGHPD